MVSLFSYISFTLTFFPMRTSRAGAEHGACVSGASQQHRKIQRIRALTRGSPPTTVISPKSFDSWVSSHARHLTKDLGAYSPREIPMRKSMSAHELYNYALLVGSPLSLSLQNREQDALQGPKSSKPASGSLERENTSPGTQHPLQSRRLARAKSRTYAS